MNKPTRTIKAWKAYMAFCDPEPVRYALKSYIHNKAGKIKLNGAKHNDPARPSK